MPAPFDPPSTNTLERIRQLAERQLSPEEFEAYIQAPMTDAERNEILESIAWFKKRYPTPADRLAATRRASRQWSRRMRDGASNP